MIVAAPNKMTAKTLNALKGWPSPSAVDFTAEFDESVFDIVTRVEQGSVVHLNDDLKYELGVGTLDVMPLFTFQASDDPDVLNEGGDPATEKDVWIAINPTGQVMALPANLAAELVSTAFTGDDGDFTPNTLLTSPIAGANAGRLVPGTKGTDMICAIVSRGITNNGYGFDGVAFWPHIHFPDA